jgi:hypothetical protein
MQQQQQQQQHQADALLDGNVSNSGSSCSIGLDSFLSSSSSSFGSIAGESELANSSSSSSRGNDCGSGAHPVQQTVLHANPSALSWADSAVRLTLGLTALAGPAFQLVEAVLKQSCSHLSELQQKQQSAVALSLLEPISVGLHSNALLLTELSRWDLLPLSPGTSSTYSMIHDILAVMQSKSAAVAASVGIAVPNASADLDTFDAFWQAVELEPIDKLKLSQALTGLPVPAGHLTVGCRNPCWWQRAFLEDARVQHVF